MKVCCLGFGRFVLLQEIGLMKFVHNVVSKVARACNIVEAKACLDIVYNNKFGDTIGPKNLDSLVTSCIGLRLATIGR